MPARIIFWNGGVRVSREGVDVFSPPNLNDDSLIFSSEWDRVDRLHAVILYGPFLWGANGQSVNFYFAPLSSPPIVSVRYFRSGPNDEREVTPIMYKQEYRDPDSQNITAAYYWIRNFLTVTSYKDHVTLSGFDLGSYGAFGGNVIDATAAGYNQQAIWDMVAQIAVYRP